MSGFHRSSRPKRRSFGLTWWGKAWVDAVEQNAGLEETRLPRGRTYARWGYVGSVSLQPGLVTARVSGSRPKPYVTSVNVRQFSDRQWDDLFDVVSSKIAHAAALIDGELEADLVDDAHAVGIDLLPTAGEIAGQCSCPDGASPCKHAAAVCYVIVDLLDDDPFALLHLRGRNREQVITALRARRKRPDPPASGVTTSEQVPAKEVFARRERGPLPHVPHAPARPGPVALLPNDVPLDSDVFAEDLETLAAGAAQRAWEMCTGVGDSGLKSPMQQDLIRRLAPLVDTPEFDALCNRTRIIRSSTEESARLWREGGELALHESTVYWEPEPDELEPGIAYLNCSPTAFIEGNSVICMSTGRQLRLGESGRWYEYRKVNNRMRFIGLAEI